MSEPPRETSPESVAMPDKFELIRQSYAEVLDATKHLDDKIGRFLTAIAFLTTGAIALLFNGPSLGETFAFTSDIPFPGSYPLLGLAAAGFFACILSSVAILLLCLSAPLRLPGKQLDWGPKLTGSRLFFSYIGSEIVNHWANRWDNESAEKIRRDLFHQYVLETHNLSERARTKYQHTHEASALFVWSLLFLGCAVGLTLVAQMNPPDVGGPVTAPGAVTLSVGLVAVVHAFVQLYARVVHDRRSTSLAFDSAKGGKDSEARLIQRSVESEKWLLVTVSAFIASLSLPGQGVVPRRIAFALALASVVVTFLLSRPRWVHSSNRSKLLRGVIYGLVPVVVAGVGLGLGGIYQICAILVAPSWLSCLSIAENYRRSSITLAKAKEQGARLKGSGTRVPGAEPPRSSSGTAVGRPPAADES